MVGVATGSAGLFAEVKVIMPMQIIETTISARVAYTDTVDILRFV